MKRSPGQFQPVATASKAEKRHPNIVISLFDHLENRIKPTLPKISSGKPTNVSKLFRSDVRNSDGRERVEALAARGGEPQSSNVCSKQGMRDIREYWYVHRRSTG